MKVKRLSSYLWEGEHKYKNEEIDLVNTIQFDKFRRKAIVRYSKENRYDG